jgi:hypothetical protein
MRRQAVLPTPEKGLFFLGWAGSVSPSLAAEDTFRSMKSSINNWGSVWASLAALLAGVVMTSCGTSQPISSKDPALQNVKTISEYRQICQSYAVMLKRDYGVGSEAYRQGRFRYIKAGAAANGYLDYVASHLANGTSPDQKETQASAARIASASEQFMDYVQSLPPASPGTRGSTNPPPAATGAGGAVTTALTPQQTADLASKLSSSALSMAVEIGKANAERRQDRVKQLRGEIEKLRWPAIEDIAGGAGQK